MDHGVVHVVGVALRDGKDESIQIEILGGACLGLNDKAVFFHAITANGCYFLPADKKESVKESVIRKGDFSRAVEYERDAGQSEHLVIAIFIAVREVKAKEDDKNSEDDEEATIGAKIGSLSDDLSGFVCKHEGGKSDAHGGHHENHYMHRIVPFS